MCSPNVTSFLIFAMCPDHELETCCGGGDMVRHVQKSAEQTHPNHCVILTQHVWVSAWTCHLFATLANWTLEQCTVLYFLSRMLHVWIAGYIEWFINWTLVFICMLMFHVLGSPCDFVGLHEADLAHAHYWKQALEVIWACDSGMRKDRPTLLGQTRCFCKNSEMMSDVRLAFGHSKPQTRNFWTSMQNWGQCDVVNAASKEQRFQHSSICCSSRKLRHSTPGDRIPARRVDQCRGAWAGASALNLWHFVTMSLCSAGLEWELLRHGHFGESFGSRDPVKGGKVRWLMISLSDL